MTNNPVRFALVGAGFIGRVIADTLARVDGADLRLVVARSERSARTCSAAMIRSTASRVTSRGFSMSTCLPA